MIMILWVRHGTKDIIALSLKIGLRYFCDVVVWPCQSKLVHDVGGLVISWNWNWSCEDLIWLWLPCQLKVRCVISSGVVSQNWCVRSVVVGEVTGPPKIAPACALSVEIGLRGGRLALSVKIAWCMFVESNWKRSQDFNNFALYWLFSVTDQN